MKLRQVFFILIQLVLVPTIELAADSTVKVGWIGPLTGNASVLGVDCVAAMELVIDTANRSKALGSTQLKLVIADDQYVAAKTVAAYNKLVHQEGIRVIVVLTYGGLFSLSERAEKDGVILIDPLDCDEQIAKLPSNTLCVTKKTEDLGRINAQHVLANNLLPAGIIYYDGDPFMGIAADATADVLKNSGHQWKFKETYNDQIADFRTLILKAKQAGLKSLFFYGYDQIGLAMKEARNQGLNSTFYTLAPSASPGFKALAGPALQGTYFPIWEAPRAAAYAEFLEKFQTKVGRAPYFEVSTVPSYDIAQIIVEGLKAGALKQDGTIDMDSLRSHFYGVKNFAGASGNITIDPDGITRSFVVTERVWKDGVPVAVQ